MMKGVEALTSSASNEWATPETFFKQLEDEFRFDLDPCATPENRKAARYFTSEVDGLTQSWHGNVFMNPPYSAVRLWMAKAVDEYRSGALVVALVPARVDTRWWHESVMEYACEVRLVKGRLHFGGPSDQGHNAPFPVAVVVFRPGLTGPPVFTAMDRV